MKNILLLVILIIIITLNSCKKTRGEVIPSTQTTNTTAAISFDIQDQAVRLSLNNNTLVMNYTENIKMLIRTDSLQSSYSVIFNEGFNATQLKNFHYTTVTKFGAHVIDWVDNNLNNIQLSEKKDTIINNIAVTKITFSRSLLYTTIYNSAKDALNTSDLLLETKDKLPFAAYITYYGKNSSVYKTQSNLIYSLSR